jgi:hypothetical protein
VKKPVCRFDGRGDNIVGKVIGSSTTKNAVGKVTGNTNTNENAVRKVTGNTNDHAARKVTDVGGKNGVVANLKQFEENRLKNRLEENRIFNNNNEVFLCGIKFF